MAEGLQNDAKDPVVRSMRRKSAIMDTGRGAVTGRGVFADASVRSVGRIHIASSVSTSGSDDGRLPRSPKMTGEL